MRLLKTKSGVRLQHRQLAWRADGRAGRDADLRETVVEGERGNVRTFAILKIVNHHAAAGRLAVKISCVADDVAGHAPHAGALQRGSERLENAPEIGAIPAIIESGVAVAGDDQIAVNCAGIIGFGRRVNGRGNFVVAAEFIERERAGEHFAIGRRTHQPVGMRFKQRLVGIERNDFDAPQRAVKARLRQIGGEGLAAVPPAFECRRLVSLAQAGFAASQKRRPRRMKPIFGETDEILFSFMIRFVMIQPA